MKTSKLKTSRQNLTSLYSPRYFRRLVQILIESKFATKPYLVKINKTKNFNRIDLTPLPKNLKYLSYIIALGAIVEILAGISLIALGINGNIVGGVFFGISLIIIYPILWAYVLALALILYKAVDSTNSQG